MIYFAPLLFVITIFGFGWSFSSKRCNSIHEAVTLILHAHSIRNREDLDHFCGGKNRKRMYTMVKELAPEAWTRTKVPNSRVRWAYEERVEGYALHKKANKV